MPFAFSLYVGSTLNPIFTYEYFFKTTADDFIESGQVVWCKSNLRTLESYAVVKESLQNKKTTYLYYERRFGGDELFYEYLNNSFKVGCFLSLLDNIGFFIFQLIFKDLSL